MYITIYKYILDLSAIIVVGIFHCCVVAHLPSHVVGSVGVVDVNLGLSPDVSNPLAFDQAEDDKEGGEGKDKDSATWR